MRQLLGSLALLAAAIATLGAQPANDRLIVAERVDKLTRESRWRAGRVGADRLHYSSPSRHGEDWERSLRVGC